MGLKELSKETVASLVESSSDVQEAVLNLYRYLLPNLMAEGEKGNTNCGYPKVSETTDKYVEDRLIDLHSKKPKKLPKKLARSQVAWFWLEVGFTPVKEMEDWVADVSDVTFVPREEVCDERD